jgi:hypothetical protein
MMWTDTKQYVDETTLPVMVNQSLIQRRIKP